MIHHDRGRVLADLACAIADGAEVISDFRVMADQGGLFGPVASVSTCWRALDEIAAGGSRALTRITATVNAARRQAWAGIEARHGALPGIAVAGRTLDGVTGAPLPPGRTTIQADTPADVDGFIALDWKDDRLVGLEVPGASSRLPADLLDEADIIS